MKRIFKMILPILFMLFFASCSKEPVNNQTDTTPETESVIASVHEKKAIKGIDVSSYSGKIDWKKVKNDGIEFAVIRVGGRGYGESGALYSDKNAAYNLTQAKLAGIKTGAYFFSQATSAEEAAEEARLAVNSCKGKKLELPIAYDVEHIKGDTSRIDKVKYSDSVKYAKAFIKEVKAFGYEAMIYIGEDSILKAEDFKGYKIWLADYGKAYDSGYEILQYSKSGKIDGISGAVDLDVIYE